MVQVQGRTNARHKTSESDHPRHAAVLSQLLGSAKPVFPQEEVGVRWTLLSSPACWLQVHQTIPCLIVEPSGRNVAPLDLDVHPVESEFGRLALAGGNQFLPKSTSPCACAHCKVGQVGE